MNIIPVFLVALFLVSGATQETDTRVTGRIYGIVIGRDGNPAEGIGLTASPLGVPLAATLPEARSDKNGKYTFDKLPWWGRYTVYAEDPQAGYSHYSTGPGDPGRVKEVTLSPEHPEAEFNLRLPPQAGRLEVHLTDQTTGAAIPGMEISVLSKDEPAKIIFSESCASNNVILIPPDKELLLHVTSLGFQEWDKSAGKGKPIRIASGSHLKLDIQLAPTQ
jgi:hypothetical protein